MLPHTSVIQPHQSLCYIFALKKSPHLLHMVHSAQQTPANAASSAEAQQLISQLCEMGIKVVADSESPFFLLGNKFLASHFSHPCKSQHHWSCQRHCHHQGWHHVIYMWHLHTIQYAQCGERDLLCSHHWHEHWNLLQLCKYPFYIILAPWCITHITVPGPCQPVCNWHPVCPLQKVLNS